MSDSVGGVSPEILSRENAAALVQRLKEYPEPLTEAEQAILDVLVYLLSDPIERLKLGPSGQFSDEEETILRELERGTA